MNIKNYIIVELNEYARCVFCGAAIQHYSKYFSHVQLSPQISHHIYRNHITNQIKHIPFVIVRDTYFGPGLFMMLEDATFDAYQFVMNFPHLLFLKPTNQDQIEKMSDCAKRRFILHSRKEVDDKFSEILIESNYSCVICGIDYENGIPHIEVVLKHFLNNHNQKI